jgi:hypothetical protein
MQTEKKIDRIRAACGVLVQNPSTSKPPNCYGLESDLYVFKISNDDTNNAVGFDWNVFQDILTIPTDLVVRNEQNENVMRWQDLPLLVEAEIPGNWYHWHETGAVSHLNNSLHFGENPHLVLKGGCEPAYSQRRLREVGLPGPVTIQALSTEEISSEGKTDCFILKNYSSHPDLIVGLQNYHVGADTWRDVGLVDDNVHLEIVSIQGEEIDDDYWPLALWKLNHRDKGNAILVSIHRLVSDFITIPPETKIHQPGAELV